MSAVDWLVLSVIVAIIFLAVFYIWRAKKKGKKCIGCPDGGACCGNCSGCDKRV